MAWVLGLLFIFAAIAIAFAMSGLYGWFPLAASAMARDYDDQFLLTLLLTGFFFVLLHLILSYIVVRFRGGRRPASYWHGNIKWVWAIVIVMALLDLGLAVGSESLWAKLHLTDSPPDVLQIEVVGQQFVWTSRYKGPDGRFGRVKRDLVDDAINPLGVDESDRVGLLGGGSSLWAGEALAGRRSSRALGRRGSVVGGEKLPAGQGLPALAQAARPARQALDAATGSGPSGVNYRFRGAACFNGTSDILCKPLAPVLTMGGDCPESS